MERHHHANPKGLAERWHALRVQDPQIRIRNAAHWLGVSELELLCTRVGDGVTRLVCEDFREMVRGLEGFGVVKAITRNDHVVHEKIGRYQNIAFETETLGQVLDANIDLRLFLWTWEHAVAVEEPTRRGMRRSIQFFDAHGVSLHKVYLVEDSDVAAYDAYVERFRSADTSRQVEVRPARARTPETPDADIDVSGFQQAWREMQDTHAFHGLVRRFGLSRTQALRLAPEGFAERVAPKAFEAVFERSAAEALPIMVFVRSPGVFQIHTGPVSRLVEVPGWFNVLDPTFDLHVRSDAVASAWVVRKPTEDGVVTSLELYDAEGEALMLLFGERKPGRAEREAWRAVLEGLERQKTH